MLDCDKPKRGQNVERTNPGGDKPKSNTKPKKGQMLDCDRP